MTNIKFERPRVFAFDATTGEYLAEVRPEIDQVALNNDEVRFILPAFTTLIAPPAKVLNQKPVWDGQQWNQVQDHRGEVWYSVGSGAVPVKISDLGDPSSVGLQVDKPVTEQDSVAKEKQELMEKIHTLGVIGTSYTALKQDIPPDVVTQHSDLAGRLRDLIQNEEK